MAASSSATKNYYVGPSDGWAEIVDATSTNLIFLRTSSVPHTHPYYVYSGSSAPSLAPTAATGTVTFSTANPTAAHVVTIGAETYTFVASGATGTQVNIGADFTATAQAFKTVVNANSTLVVASGAAATITLTAVAAGAQGNAITLTTNDSNIAVSGANLASGLDIVQGVLVCHHPFKVFNTSSTPNGSKFWVRVVSPVPNSQRSDGKLRIDVYADGGALQ